MNGIDIASYQAGINLGAVPCDFVIIKATQGTRYKNPDFDRAYQNAVQNKKCIGFYHYASQGGAEQEAQHFLDVVGKREGILVLDWEKGDNVNYGNLTYARKFLEYVEKRSGKTPFIYMSKSVCREYNWSVMSKYPLWVAQYANSKPTGYQANPWTDNGGYGAWKSPKIFQYSSKGQLAGWSGNLDLNIAYMTKAEWNQYASGAAADPAADPFKPYAAIVTASALRVRTGPGTSYSQKQVGGSPMYLPTGMVVAVAEETGSWGRINNINGWVSLEYLSR